VHAAIRHCHRDRNWARAARLPLGLHAALLLDLPVPSVGAPPDAPDLVYGVIQLVRHNNEPDNEPDGNREGEC